MILGWLLQLTTNGHAQMAIGPDGTKGQDSSQLKRQIAFPTVQIEEAR
jgi:hypothetical protein